MIHHHHPHAHVDLIGKGNHDVDGAVSVITDHGHGNHVHNCAHHYDDDHCHYNEEEDGSSDETWSSGISEDFYVEETEYGSDDNGGIQELGQVEQSHGSSGLRRMHLQSEGAATATGTAEIVEMQMAQSETTSNDGDDEGEGSGRRSRSRSRSGSGSRSRSRSRSGVSCWSRPIGNKPHKAQDAAWAAIRGVISSEEGAIGLHHFRFLQRLGSGDIGTVYLTQLLKAEAEAEEGVLGTDSSTGLYYAMKIVDKRALAKRNKLHRATAEREILEILDHPFLPTLYAHIDDGRQSCLVMEFCPGGDLHVLRQLQPGKRFAGSAVRFYAVEVLMALEYLHMMGVVYRDLKPENVLVREDGHIMLSDFDLSLKCNVEPAIATTSTVRGNSCGGGVGVGVGPDKGWAPTPPHGAHLGLCSSSSCMDTPLRCGVVSPCSIHPITSCLPIRNCLVPYFAGRRPRHHAQPQHLIKTNNTTNNGSRNSAPELLAEPTSVRSMSFVGTHEYLAPEIILGEGHGAAVDWWTFGIFLYELLHGRTPFKGPDNEATLTNVVTQLLKFPPTLGTSTTATDHSLAQHSRNPQGNTSCYMEAQDLIKRLLVKDPRKRFGAVKGATEIKQHPFFRGVNWALVRCATPPEIPLPFSLGTNHNLSKDNPSSSHLVECNKDHMHKHDRWVSNDDNGGGAAPEFKLF